MSTITNKSNYNLLDYIIPKNIINHSSRGLDLVMDNLSMTSKYVPVYNNLNLLELMFLNDLDNSYFNNLYKLCELNPTVNLSIEQYLLLIYYQNNHNKKNEFTFKAEILLNDKLENLIQEKIIDETTLDFFSKFNKSYSYLEVLRNKYSNSIVINKIQEKWLENRSINLNEEYILEL